MDRMIRFARPLPVAPPVPVLPQWRNGSSGDHRPLGISLGPRAIRTLSRWRHQFFSLQHLASGSICARSSVKLCIWNLAQRNDRLHEHVAHTTEVGHGRQHRGRPRSLRSVVSACLAPSVQLRRELSRPLSLQKRCCLLSTDRRGARRRASVHWRIEGCRTRLFQAGGGIELAWRGEDSCHAGDSRWRVQRQGDHCCLRRTLRQRSPAHVWQGAAHPCGRLRGRLDGFDVR